MELVVTQTLLPASQCQKAKLQETVDVVSPVIVEYEVTVVVIVTGKVLTLEVVVVIVL